MATIVLHWGTVAAIVIAVAAIYLREATEDKALRQVLLEVHRQLGMLILAAVALRLTVRYWCGLADHSAGMPALLLWAAACAHMALYAMLTALPILGWAASNAHGVDVTFLGLVQMPFLVAANSDLADRLDDLHKWGAWALGALVAAHASAALWHHFVRRDAVLASMLPAVAPRSALRAPSHDGIQSGDRALPDDADTQASVPSA
jgi:cytochrome b561